MSELAGESTAQTTSDAATARQQFVAAQVSALAPLDFVLVAVPRPPFDAVQVLREDDGSLAVVVAGRNVAAGAPPYTPEQLTALARLGFPAAAGAEGGAEGKGVSPAGLRVATSPADAAAAATLVDSLLGDVFGVEPGNPVDVRHGSERDAREAAQRIEHMRACIEPVLAELSGGTPAPQDDDGDYVLDIGHVRVFVAPRALPGRPPPIIRVFAITNAGVNLGSELGLFLGRLNFSLMFGRFSIDADNASVWFDETLLGEHVSAEELRFTVEMVAATANEWDQKIAGMFGGRIRSPESLPPPGGAAPDGAPTNKPGQGGYL
jgi:hypothetical protein